MTMRETISCTPRSCLKQAGAGKSSSKNRSKKSKVSFKSKKVIRKIPLLSAYSAEDIDAIWYGNREVNWIMEQVNQLVIQVEESPEGATIRDIDGECLRGLERKTTDGHQEAFLARIAVYEAVLDEQENQWKKAGSKNGDNHDYDHDKIAALSKEASTDSKKAALLRAKQDEAAVQAYLYKEGPFLHKKEPELDLKQVFSKAQNKNHAKRSSSPSSDSWATASTESTTSSTSTSSSSSNDDAESDTEVSISSATSSASTNSNSSTNPNNPTGKRSSFTTAKKISTPAVPRPNAPKRKIPNRAKNLSFQKSNEPAIRRQLGIEPRKNNTNTSNLKKDTAIRPNTVISVNPSPPVPSHTTNDSDEAPKKKVVKRKSRGLSLECSAFIAQG